MLGVGEREGVGEGGGLLLEMTRFHLGISAQRSHAIRSEIAVYFTGLHHTKPALTVLCGTSILH